MVFFMENVKIRNAEISDAGAINRIYNEAVVSGVATADTVPLDILHHEKLLKQNEKDNNPFLVAHVNGEVIGWNSLSFYRYGRSALFHVRETSYYINRVYWRKGIAGKLMESIIGICPKFGVSVLISIIIDGNKGSIGLMDKYSFELWGRLPKVVIFDHGVYDNLIYGKKLDY